MAEKQWSDKKPREQLFRRVLLAASKKGDTACVTKLVAHGEKYEIVDRNAIYAEAVHAAAFEGDHPQTIEALLKTGVSVDCEGKVWAYPTWTPLMAASAKGHTETVRILLSHGANARYVTDDMYEKHALSQAASKNHVEIVKMLLEAGAHIDHVEKFGPHTALIDAADEGHLETVELLLTSGADCSALNGLRAVYGAVQAKRSKRKKIIRLLLQHGVDINYEIPPGLDMYSCITPPLIQASGKGDYKLVELLLEQKANVDVRDQYNDKDYTPLMIAVKEGHVKIVGLLLEWNANPDLITPHSWREGFYTALHFAVMYEYFCDVEHVETDRDPKTSYNLLRRLLLGGANVKFEELVAANPHIKAIRSGKTDGFKGADGFLYKRWEWQMRVPSPFPGPLELMADHDLIEDEDFEDCVHLLYAAGASMYKITDDSDSDENDEDEPGINKVRRLILEDQQPLLSLQGLCRREIRAHLLSSDGGNHPNLVTAIPQLPVPKSMQKYLLFHVPNIFEDYSDSDSDIDYQGNPIEYEEMEEITDPEELARLDALGSSGEESSD